MTDAEIIAIRDEHLPSQGESFDCIAFARAVLAWVPPTPAPAAQAAPDAPTFAPTSSDCMAHWPSADGAPPAAKDAAPDDAALERATDLLLAARPLAAGQCSPETIDDWTDRAADVIEQQAERIKALELRYTAAEERLAVYNSGGFADADALAAKMIEVMDRATKAERELAEAHEAYGRAFARAAQAEARAEALAKLIAEHNSSIEAACGANNEYNAKRNGCDSYLPRGRNCVDCPRDYLIDAAIRALGEGK